MRLVIPCFLILLSASCRSSKTESIDDYHHFSSYIPSDSNYQYLPINSEFLISNDREVDSSIKQLYSEILFHFKEPSLYRANNKLKCVRILWLNARKPPMLIRVNDIDGSRYLIRKEFNSPYDGKADDPIDTIFSADRNFWQSIFLSVDSSRFWSEEIGNINASGKDGILWVLECRLGEKYHFIERWDDGTLTSILHYPFINKIMNAVNVK